MNFKRIFFWYTLTLVFFSSFSLFRSIFDRFYHCLKNNKSKKWIWKWRKRAAVAAAAAAATTPSTSHQNKKEKNKKHIQFARTIEDHRVFNQTAQHLETLGMGKRRKFICDNVYFIMQNDLYMIWLPFMCKIRWCKFIHAFSLFSLVFIFSKWILIFWYVRWGFFFSACAFFFLNSFFFSNFFSSICCWYTLNYFSSFKWSRTAIWFCLEQYSCLRCFCICALGMTTVSSKHQCDATISSHKMGENFPRWSIKILR